MTDNELSILIRTTLLNFLAAQGSPWDTVLVASSFQAAQQGRESGPVLYYFSVSDNRYGWQGRDGAYDPDADEYTYTERQWTEHTFQVSAMFPQDPADLLIPTPKDLVSMAALLIGSRPFIDALRAGGAGMQRITQLRNPFITNDFGQFEATPNFDFTVSNLRSIIVKTPATDSFEFRQTRV